MKQQKIIAYYIAGKNSQYEKNGSPDVASEVEALIKEGWQPWGSPFLSNPLHNPLQAMVKYEEESNTK